MQNPWRVLGLEPGTDLETVKKRYRELARKYHPDFNKSPEAEQKMKEINEAYDAIMRGKNVGRKPEWQEFEFDDFFFQFDNIFNNIFTRADFFHQPKNPDMVAEVNISLEEGLNGTHKIIHTRNGETRTVTIPPGVIDGMILTFAGQGYRYSPNARAGDLLVKVNLILPPRFQLFKNVHLMTEANVSVFDLMTGTELFIEFPNSEKIIMKVPPGTSPGTKLRIKGKGYCRLNDPFYRGDLFVEIKASIPSVTDPELVREIENIRKKIE